MESNPATATKWQPLNSRQRRVLGVLVEKAKTTPDAYPMTLNGLVTGCNQKSNREPLMNLSPDDAEQTLEELRHLGAVAEVQGSGRVPKYRHFAYEWLGVDTTELAVMTELLLRGEQTLGDLRGRAARMAPIADVAALTPIVKSLVAKGLMIELTAPGRGQIVSHGLYKERELVELRQQYANYVPPSSASSDGESSGRRAEHMHPPAAAVTAHVPATPQVTRDMFNELEVEVAELRAEMARIREEIQELRAERPRDCPSAP